MSPNDFGKKILAEQCQKIRLSNFTGKANHQIKEAVLKSLVGAEGYNIQFTRSKTGFGGTRFWFSCPICGRRAEREGFEPSKPVKTYLLSKQAHSTTMRSLLFNLKQGF